VLLFAFRAISDRVERRIAEAVAALGPEAPVLTAFLARAVVEPAPAESLREGGAGLRGFIAEKIRAVPGERDAVREAATLTALVDGLMTQVLTGQVEADLAVAVLDLHLDRIFGGGPGAR